MVQVGVEWKIEGVGMRACAEWEGFERSPSSARKSHSPYIGIVVGLYIRVDGHRKDSYT